MKNKKYSEISMDYFKNFESKIDLNTTREEELIEAHIELVNKSCKDDYYEIKDCGIEFIEKFLSRDWGRSIVYQYTPEAEKFIKSKYLSDYFKNSIIELLSQYYLSDEVLNTLNSDKPINDMSEEEIKAIYSALNECYPKTKRNDKIASCFMSFLYKLDGKGVTSFIKNNISNYDLANHILLTSGLSSRASYYSGRGVNYGDLNDNNLIAIFNKLLKIDIDYAINFVDMVQKMKTLGATEFIKSFKNLAINDFKIDCITFDDSNFSLDGVYGEARDNIAFISIFSAMNQKNDNYQTIASKRMKASFMLRVKPILLKINPNYYEEQHKQSLNYNYHINEKKITKK